MREKILCELAEKIAGKNGEEIIKLLLNKKNVNEFKIADKAGLTINQTRNILYKLCAQNIIDFNRKKDKRKGWYIYFWTLNLKKSLELLIKLKEKEILQQEYLLKSRKSKVFFGCRECKTELTEETALHHNFLCPECGNLLQILEDKKFLTNIEKNIEKLKNDIETIKLELEKIKSIKSEKVKRKVVKKKKMR